MGVLDSCPARYVTIAASSLAITTILVCYSIAVYLGHVHWWLPMISDCAVDAPEKYIFRMGMISSSLLLELNVVIMYLYMNVGQTGSFVDRWAVYLASIASFGLMMVGAINEDEDDAVHSGAAVVFFFGFETYMIVTLCKMKQGYYHFTLSNSSYETKSILLLMTIVTTVAGVALVLFVYFSQNWGKWSIEIAVCEWIGTACILLYNLSYTHEFNKEVFVGALFDQTLNSSPMTSGVKSRG